MRRLGLAVAVLACSSVVIGADTRPNIILFLADDIRLHAEHQSRGRSIGIDR